MKKGYKTMKKVVIQPKQSLPSKVYMKGGKVPIQTYHLAHKVAIQPRSRSRLAIQPREKVPIQPREKVPI